MSTHQVQMMDNYEDGASSTPTSLCDVWLDNRIYASIFESNDLILLPSPVIWSYVNVTTHRMVTIITKQIWSWWRWLLLANGANGDYEMSQNTVNFIL